jgi:uncharacterized protein YxeA
MRAIILAAIIAIAIIALLFVVNARLNRRNPELEDYPRKPEGSTTSGGQAAGPEARGSPRPG